MPHDDQVDRRFREMIKAEFGDVAGTRAPGEPAPDSGPQESGRGFFRKELPDPIEYFNLSAEIDRATPGHVERWYPPTPDPIGWPPRRIMVAVGFMAVPLLLGIVAALGVVIPGTITIGAVLIFAAGLALLLLSIPRRWPNDEDAWSDSL